MPSPPRTSTRRSRHSHGRSEIWFRKHVVDELAATTKVMGGRLRALRTDRGVSQERAAELIGVHAKYLQRLENGRANASLGTLVAAALAYGVPLTRLLQREPGDLQSPEPSPFHVVDARTVRPYEGCVPLYLLAVAAGGFGSLAASAAALEPEAWVVPHGRRKPGPGLFVAQVHGQSMNRRIPNGAFCLFRSPAPEDRQGRVLLVRHRDIHDPDLAGDFTVKIWDSARRPVGAGSSRLRPPVSLVPDSDVESYRPIELPASRAAMVSVIAEMIEVLPGAGPLQPTAKR